MAEKFDFNTIQKQMPYKVPDSFFDELERDIAIRIDLGKNRKTRNFAWRFVMRAVTATAAAAAVIAMIVNVTSVSTPGTGPGMTVEQAFAELSVSDQEYLLDVYQDVTYISNQL